MHRNRSDNPTCESTTQPNPVVVTCETGLESLLESELESLGIAPQAKNTGAIAAHVTLEQAYTLCLWSRFASRVLWVISEQVCTDEQELYDLASMVPWERYFAATKSIRVLTDHSNTVSVNAQFMAFKTMDAIRDRFQLQQGARPAMVKDNPDIVVHVFWHNDSVQFSLDFAGKPLHQRQYRVEQAQAPLKETLGAALVAWSAVFDTPIVDPCCGSGTLLIEAAMVQRDMAPGLLRDSYSLKHNGLFVASIWDRLFKEAKERCKAAPDRPLLRGYDCDSKAVHAAQQNIAAAGLEDWIHIEKSELGRLQIPKSVREHQGWLLTNAPYGERVGQESVIGALYTALARIGRQQVPHWQVGVLSNHVEHIDQVGIQDATVHRINNGAIRCYFKAGGWTQRSQMPIHHAIQVSDFEPAPEQRDFVNRLRKNIKPLRKWAERETISCYRVYDADIPDFNMAVDWYDGELHVQEYKAPKTVDPEKAKQRLEFALTALVKVFDVPRSAIALKSRAPQKGKQQYKRLQQGNHFRAVYEHGVWLRVNLRDYLDTGLFLDHRPVRRWIQESAQGKRVLNLFGYTGSATVHAAYGGAKSTVTVDMSNTYLDWARANLYLNGFSDLHHRLVRANCIKWLEQDSGQYDLIFLDPPTFSNSKKMQGVFDVQRDHAALIELAMKRLEPGGKLLFSNNFKRFKLDSRLMEHFVVKDLTLSSIPTDFKGGKPVHVCFSIQHA